MCPVVPDFDLVSLPVYLGHADTPTSEMRTPPTSVMRKLPTLTMRILHASDVRTRPTSEMRTRPNSDMRTLDVPYLPPAALHVSFC